MIKKQWLLFFVLFLSCYSMAEEITISNYQPQFTLISDANGHKNIALRSFVKQGVSCYLIVDPLTLKTTLVSQRDVNVLPEDVDAAVKNSPYWRSLQRYTAAPWSLQNQGIKHAERPAARTAFLTIDLCPSSREFDKNFFSRLIANTPGSSLPVAISVSGLWIQHHEQAFQWLRQQEQQHNFAITWINHTWSHRYRKGMAIDKNFLLLPDTDLRQELLQTEALLISKGEIPSVFVRYPGLVSDKNIVSVTRQLGLIPVGADAWLAKGEKIRDGSVVLVHGNGNEPAGLRLLTNKLIGTFSWLSLDQTVIDGEGN